MTSFNNFNPDLEYCAVFDGVDMDKKELNKHMKTVIPPEHRSAVKFETLAPMHGLPNGGLMWKYDINNLSQ